MHTVPLVESGCHGGSVCPGRRLRDLVVEQYHEGTVDFIFRRSIAVFDHCTIHSKRDSTVTAASTEQNYQFGYVLLNCTFTADGAGWLPELANRLENEPLLEIVKPKTHL